MFGFFKKLKAKKIEKKRKHKEDLKSEFIAYINGCKDQNSTMEAMHSLIHHLDLDVSSLVKKHNLVIDYDFSDEDDYYEIQIYSAIESDNDFYVAIGTQEGRNTLLLQDDSEIDVDHFTSAEIILKLIKEIEIYHHNK